ncbi:MAG: hypothetical protein HP491_05825 [Nitrospira sp.]|nr:hypothetical protein [Nitrospira sp.]
MRGWPGLIGLLGLLTVPALVSAASVDVAAWKDQSFCRKVAALFGERLTPDSVEWKPVELKGQGPKTRHCSSLDQALLDLDNDGTKDLVIKTTFCMKGAPSDSLYVFPTAVSWNSFPGRICRRCWRLETSSSVREAGTR